MSSPEILEPAWRQLGVSHRVLDVAVAEVSLQRSGIVAFARRWGRARRITPSLPHRRHGAVDDDGDEKRIEQALGIWCEARPQRGCSWETVNSLG
jgi:hypothetical protein